MASGRIIIFDTTLRDGEQSPGMSMTTEEKLLVAELLDTMGVDVIEAGFAMASDGDFEAVKAIAERTKNAVVCSLARAKPADIHRAGEAVKPAKRPRIHTFISTSDIHLKYQFKLSREEVLDIIREMVTLARSYTDNVEFSVLGDGRDALGRGLPVPRGRGRHQGRRRHDQPAGHGGLWHAGDHRLHVPRRDEHRAPTPTRPSSPSTGRTTSASPRRIRSRP